MKTKKTAPKKTKKPSKKSVSVKVRARKDGRVTVEAKSKGDVDLRGLF